MCRVRMGRRHPEGRRQRGSGNGGGEIAWGANRQGKATLDGEDQHRVRNWQWWRKNDGWTITREWAGKTRRRSHYGVALNDGNGVTQNQRRHTRGKQSQVNGVPKETVRGHGIHIATTNIRLGRAGGLESALRALWQGNIRIGVLQETKHQHRSVNRWRRRTNDGWPSTWE